MTTKLLFRASLAEEDELLIAREYFPVIDSRALAEPGDLIIGRYSCLPYYHELEKDLRHRGAFLINSSYDHHYIADLREWYWDFADLTPRTWFRPEDVPQDHPGSFVLKGATNSRKQLWKTHMFAKTRADIMTVYCRLLDDSLISGQGVYIREFEPFVSFGEGINGIPISEEYRFFFCGGQLIAGGFYWSEQDEEVQKKTDPTLVPAEFLQEVASRIPVPFVVVDIARHQDGRWRVVELNDGQMAGTSSVDLNTLYRNLRLHIDRVQQTHR